MLRRKTSASRAPLPPSVQPRLPWCWAGESAALVLLLLARYVVVAVAVVLVLDEVSETDVGETLQDGEFEEFAPDGELVREQVRDTVPE